MHLVSVQDNDPVDENSEAAVLIGKHVLSLCFAVTECISASCSFSCHRKGQTPNREWNEMMMR